MNVGNRSMNARHAVWTKSDTFKVLHSNIMMYLCIIIAKYQLKNIIYVQRNS